MFVRKACGQLRTTLRRSLESAIQFQVRASRAAAATPTQVHLEIRKTGNPIPEFLSSKFKSLERLLADPILAARTPDAPPRTSCIRDSGCSRSR